MPSVSTFSETAVSIGRFVHFFHPALQYSLAKHAG